METVRTVSHRAATVALVRARLLRAPQSDARRAENEALWTLGNRWGHDYAPSAWLVLTSPFHGSALLSRHRSPLAAVRLRTRRDCGPGCTCGGPVVVPEPVPALNQPEPVKTAGRALLAALDAWVEKGESWEPVERAAAALREVCR